MGSRKWGALLDYMRNLTAVPAGPASDAALLDRFVTRRDETAFADLYTRHGPLVWSVCRRVLGPSPDAEDALQATFLVLLRKAHAISKRASVRSWLYGVAYKIAARARADGVRRQLPAHAADVPDPFDDVAARELRTVLDDEVSLLPERLRLAIVLCYFEGRTHDEAARLLGCPRGTIASNLARAKQRLQRQLARRGVALGTGAIAAGLAHAGAQAASTLPALTFPGAAATAAVSARALALADGATRAMCRPAR